MFLMREALPNLNGEVRFLHGIPITGQIDIYVDGDLIVEKLSFGNISDYINLAPKEYLLQIYPSGKYDSPIYQQNIEIIPANKATLSLVILNNNIDLFMLKDPIRVGGTNDSFLRFINMSQNAPLLNLSLPNGNILFRGVEYLETTGYYPLSSGIYNFVISATNSALSKFINQLTLNAGNFYTIYIIGVFNGKPPLGSLFVEDGKEITK